MRERETKEREGVEKTFSIIINKINDTQKESKMKYYTASKTLIYNMA